MESVGSFGIGDWRVYPSLNQLEREGKTRRLEPKAMDVLCTLAGHAGEVLSKERLIQAVWPDTFVGDDVLAHAISQLRKAFDDNPREPRFIETIVRRGYRVVAEVSLDQPPQAAAGNVYRFRAEPTDRQDAASERPAGVGSRATLRLLRPEEEQSPYPGLAPFTEQDRAVFFGREEEIEELWEKIARRRLLAVIGPSGVGKTSFLRAGVMPARPEGWAAVYAKPGSSPALSLAQGLTEELAGDALALQELLAAVAELTAGGDSKRLVAAVRQWRTRHREALLVIDQFEELFTLNPPEVQKAFAGLVRGLALDADLHVVLSMRDDFHFRCSEHPALASVFDSITPLPTLSREALRRTLEEPAARQGYRFEDENLVKEIVAAVEGEQGSLPLLAFAVSRLWEKRDRDRKLLTREAYFEIGGVEGALAGHAEATLERIPAEHQSVVREILRNLVTAQGTRAVMDREELLSVFSDRTTAEEVLRLLVNARLLTTYQVEGKTGEDGSRRVEVVHESLLKAWPRLVRWQAQDEEGAVLRDQLRQAAHLWAEKGRSRDLLWTGTAHRELTLWRERYPGSLTGLEEDFARAMAERARRRSRLVRISVAAAFLVLLALAVAIGVSRQQAVEAFRRSEASKLLALAQLKLADDPTEALAYATASLETSDTQEARLFALKALADGPVAFELDTAIPWSCNPAFNPDGTRLAVTGLSSEAGVWDQDGALLVRLAGLEPSPNANLGAWADNDLLVTGVASGGAKQAQLWSVREGREVRAIDFPILPESRGSFWGSGYGWLYSVTFSGGPTGRQFASLRSWQLPGGEEVDLGRVNWTALGAQGGMITPDVSAHLYFKGDSVWLQPLPIGSGPDRRFSRHRSTVTLAGDLRGTGRYWFRDDEGRIRIWSFDGATPKDPVDLPKPETAPATIQPEPSGRWLWKPPSGDLGAQVWSLDGLSAARPLTLRRNASWYFSHCEVHPTGNWLVCSTARGDRLTFWPLPARPPMAIDGYRVLQRLVAFSPDSRWLATSWGDRKLRLWPLPGTGTRVIRPLDVPQTFWTAMTFDPAGRYFFGAGRGSVVMVPLEGGPTRTLEPFPNEAIVFGLDVSPSGRLLAGAVGYGPVTKILRIWDLETGSVRDYPLPAADSVSNSAPGEQTGYEAGVACILFEGESTLYTSGSGGIRHWNLDSGVQTLLKSGSWVQMWQVGDGPLVCARISSAPGGARSPHSDELVNLATGDSRPAAEFTAFGDFTAQRMFCAAGPLIAGTSSSGLVRIGRLSGGPPHVLAGHHGSADAVAISPDLRWVASTGEDNTLRLWPMPDLSKPTLHTLPHDELIAKLKSLTNLRAVPDPAAENGWKIELDKFPGWKEVPTW